MFEILLLGLVRAIATLIVATKHKETMTLWLAARAMMIVYPTTSAIVIAWEAFVMRHNIISLIRQKEPIEVVKYIFKETKSKLSSEFVEHSSRTEQPPSEHKNSEADLQWEDDDYSDDEEGFYPKDFFSEGYQTSKTYDTTSIHEIASGNQEVSWVKHCWSSNKEDRKKLIKETPKYVRKSKDMFDPMFNEFEDASETKKPKIKFYREEDPIEDLISGRKQIDKGRSDLYNAATYDTYRNSPLVSIKTSDDWRANPGRWDKYMQGETSNLMLSRSFETREPFILKQDQARFNDFEADICSNMRGANYISSTSKSAMVAQGVSRLIKVSGKVIQHTDIPLTSKKTKHGYTIRLPEDSEAIDKSAIVRGEDILKGQYYNITDPKEVRKLGLKNLRSWEEKLKYHLSNHGSDQSKVIPGVFKATTVIPKHTKFKHNLNNMHYKYESLDKDFWKLSANYKDPDDYRYRYEWAMQRETARLEDGHYAEAFAGVFSKIASFGPRF